MTTEEKAKRYDEAFEKAKEINNEQRAQPFNVMTRVFPELKESEDERIRKELIDYINSEYRHTLGLDKKNRFIAWLEKQGEQKPADYEKGHIQQNDFAPKSATEAANEEKVDNQNCIKSYAQEHIGDKVEPKFKVGDKIYLKPEYRMPDDDTPIANTVFEIRVIDDKHYRFDGSYIFIEDQDKYELVESAEDVDAQINSQNEAIKQLNRALNSMEHGGHLPEINAAESLGIPQKEYDKIVDECIYGKEPEMVDIDDLPEQESVSEGIDIDAIKEELYKAVRIYKPNGDFGWGTLYNIACHFANWQKKIDADLGSPAYERGYCDGRAFEAKRFQNRITQEDYDLAKAAAYEAGKQVMKQQMMKDAVEAEITKISPNDHLRVVSDVLPLKDESEWGTRVKLIIIKEGRL